MNKKMITAAFMAMLFCIAGCNSDGAVTSSTPALTVTEAEKTEAATTSETAAEKTETTTTSQTAAEVIPEETEDESLKKLREAAAGNTLAVYFVGFIDDNTAIEDCISNSGISENYSFVNDIPGERFVNAGGSELYCIVPVDKDLNVWVKTAELNDEAAIVPVETIYEAKGEPFMLQGNYSDIFSNMIIGVEKGEEVFEYSPCLSLMDGTLATPEDGVYDFSVYG